MVQLLALLALLQPAPATETSGRFEYQRPADWRSEALADGTRVLRPPGDSAEVVRFLPPEPWAGAPEAYHDALHAALRQGAAILSGGKAEKLGDFLRSEAVVGPAGQPQLWMALYTARAGDSFQAIVYASPTAGGFARHRAAADAIARSIALPGPRERVSEMELSLPRGWKRQDDPAQSTVSLYPGDLGAGPLCGLVILPARELAATIEAHEDQMWSALAANATADGRPASSQQGLFRSRRASLQTGQGRAWMILYTARRGTSVETMFFAASTKAHFDKHGAEADRLVGGITFPGVAVAAPAVPAAAWKPSPIAPADRRVKITGLWINASTKLRHGVDFSGFGTAMRSRIEMLVLWENGIAYRGNVDASPTPAPLGVVEGLAAVDAAGLAARPAFADKRFGRPTRTAGGLEIKGLDAGDLTLTRDGASFLDQDGGKWTALAPVDGTRLDGTYVCAAIPSRPEMRVTFRKDGSFEAVNLNHTVGSPTSNPSFPASGKGAYEFQSWSLILRFEGGFTQAIAFVKPGDSLAGARSIVISGSELVRS